MEGVSVSTNGDHALDTAAQNSAYSPSLQYQVAKQYYLGNATQAELAQAFNLSRATISRVLTQARACGIVRIEVRDPGHQASSLSNDLCEALGLHRAYISPTTKRRIGQSLAFGVHQALNDVGLSEGDALLVSSGTTMLEISHESFPALPGVIVAPMIGAAIGFLPNK